MTNENQSSPNASDPVPALVDARGLACPTPVMLTVKQLQHNTIVNVLVDNEVAVQNVSRLAASKGFSVQLERFGSYFSLLLEKQDSASAPREASSSVHDSPSKQFQGGQSAADHTADNYTFICDCSPEPVTLIVTSSAFGTGAPELGELLMGSFFQSLLEITPLPKTIALLNSGIKLAMPESRALEQLQALSAKGCEILVCGACLDFYKLTDKLAIGQISNMYAIATAMITAKKLVKL